MFAPVYASLIYREDPGRKILSLPHCFRPQPEGDGEHFLFMSLVNDTVVLDCSGGGIVATSVTAHPEVGYTA